MQLSWGNSHVEAFEKWEGHLKTLILFQFFMCFIVLCLVTVSKEKKWSIRNQKLVFVSWTVWVLAIQQGAHL